METNKHEITRNLLFVFFLLSILILTACKPNASASKPFPDMKEWDLLIISDSSNWGVGQYYAKLIEADNNVKVNLHDCWVGGLTIKHILKTLQSGGSINPDSGDKSCQRPWADLVKDAEVMVLFGNPLDSNPPDGSWDIPENAGACILGGYEGKHSLSGFETYKEKMLKSCAPETLATYEADLGAVIDEIDKIREGRPLILRMTDLYIPFHSSWLQYGVEEVCTICVGYTTKAVLQVADEHGVPVADTMAGLNGKDYKSEMPAGFIRADGRHLTNSGAQFVAKVLQQTGYGYVGK